MLTQAISQAVAMLAAMESIKGNIKELHIHMNALTKMVKLRGVRELGANSPTLPPDRGYHGLPQEQKFLIHVVQLLFIIRYWYNSTNAEMIL